MEMHTNPMTSKTADEAEEEIPAIDLDHDEDEVLKRYHTMFTILKNRKICPVFPRPMVEADIGVCIQLTAVDFAVCHAIQGSGYIDEIQDNNNYLVLQAALILTITMPSFINPPDFEDSQTEHFFSACMGIAAFTHLFVIIGATIFAAILNSPFTASDTMVARIQSQILLVTIQVMNYIANILFIIAALTAGFNRSDIDGGIQLIVCGLYLCGLLFLFVKAKGDNAKFQDSRVYLFYKKYCHRGGSDAFDGALLPEYVTIAKTNKEK